ncbi:helix-turn-helix domain-containing protein [Ruminococcaceae bacterium OttesenSCG-928-A16]|nr:helix-turn-helix domain-containing protein [Ruminococcaceae bacterium OttesenSCG-928-A16]
MNMADRIQLLRKAKGISQEELADKIGVSRQSVSKWESEQSMPDMDKVIILSDYFEVTTDYILKGIENKAQTNEKPANAAIFTIVSTALNFMGLIISAAVWYEQQVPMALVVGLIFMALGCMVFGIGIVSSASNKQKAKQLFWMINIWILAFIPLSFIYNVLFTGLVAPYPLLGGSLIAYPVFWLVYFVVCLAVVFAQVKAAKNK